MSPLSLRRYRAERLLAQQFDGLRERVLTSVRGQLRASGVSLDDGDLEACYAIAWQGLYAAVLEGQEIANPPGWLVVVTFRRALDEHRAGARRADRDRGSRPRARRERAAHAERDLAAELDDRTRLRQLFEGLRGRLSEREREAATLCYLQGLSRAQAAARMGVSEGRMRKLMEGRGQGRPGVAGKVGALVETIRDGDWCEEQGSLMRALAYGILDPQGERYRLALTHRSQCPACRAYVTSLRGLAAVLPPALLPWGLGAGILARAGEGAHASAVAGATSGGRGVGGGGGGGGGAVPASGASGASGAAGAVGAAGARGAAGAGGAAGGGWLLAGGPLSAKLALGCVLALGVGAGCVALDDGQRAHVPRHARRAGPRAGGDRGAEALAGYRLDALAAGTGESLPGAAGRAGAPSALTPARKASREFGPEQALASGAAGASAGGGRRAASARSASAGSRPSGTSAGVAGDGAAGSSQAPAAEREFAPG
jgi:RNA polymerase sigma factor (sigma-70 family)